MIIFGQNFRKARSGRVSVAACEFVQQIWTRLWTPCKRAWRRAKWILCARSAKEWQAGKVTERTWSPIGENGVAWKSLVWACYRIEEKKTTTELPHEGARGEGATEGLPRGKRVRGEVARVCWIHGKSALRLRVGAVGFKIIPRNDGKTKNNTPNKIAQRPIICRGLIYFYKTCTCKNCRL